MFLPSNRHLLVQPVELTNGAPAVNSTAGVLLPEDYKVVKEHEVAKILSISDDCEKFSEDSLGHYIVFPGNMLKQVLIGEETISLIQENYIMGVYVPEGQEDD